MTKQEVEHKIKDMLLKHPSLKDAEIEITFKDKGKKQCKTQHKKQNENTKKSL